MLTLATFVSPGSPYTVSSATVSVFSALLPSTSVLFAVTVNSPSARLLTSMPVTVYVPFSLIVTLSPVRSMVMLFAGSALSVMTKLSRLAPLSPMVPVIVAVSPSPLINSSPLLSVMLTLATFVSPGSPYTVSIFALSVPAEDVLPY